MANYTQDKRLLQFTSAVVGTDKLLAQKVEGKEAFSQLYEYNLTCLANRSQGAVDTSKLLGSKVGLQFTSGNSYRYISGIVALMSQASGDDTFDVYQLRIVPPLWHLTLNYDCRIFSDQTPMEIISAVIQPYMLEVKDKTDKSQNMPKLEYCTQFNESDYNFICRVAERYGIFFWFEHFGSESTVFFANSVNGYTSNELNLFYAPQEEDAEASYQPIITSFQCSNAMVTGKHLWSVADYRSADNAPKEVGPENSKQQQGKNALERYTYSAEGAAAFKTLASEPVIDKAKLATLLQTQRGAYDMAMEIYGGETSAPWAAVGRTVEMQQHPKSEWNTKYLLISTSLTATQSPAYESSTKSKDEKQGFHMTFEAIKPSVLYVPAPNTPKPRIAGTQPARVTWLENMNLNVDALGRVNVQFLWERNRIATIDHNCWVRVAQQWAGSFRGSFFWPRAGDEVLVAFMDGDPDDPVIVGSLYNKLDNTVYKLPDNQTRSGWFTRSLDGKPEVNASSFYFEDASGKEEVHLHAERNLNISVEAVSTRMVGGDETIGVWGDQGTHHKKNVVRTVQQKVKEKLYDDYDRLILGRLTEEVENDVCMKIDGREMRDVGASYGLQAGGEIHINGKTNVIMDAAQTLQIGCGGNFIQIGPTGIFIVGTMVMINSGGAAVTGSGISTDTVSIKDAPPWIMDPKYASNGDPIPGAE